MMVRVAENILNFTPPINRSHEMNRNFLQSFEDGTIMKIPSDKVHRKNLRR